MCCKAAKAVWYALSCMRRTRPALFQGRHFEADIIILCVRWYLRFPLSYRNLEEIMAERNLSVDHVRSEMTYYPYGDEKGSVSANDRVKYATYWRDGESGLDYAMNRYYHAG